jgi:mono/diheme cytochrome c family protein
MRALKIAAIAVGVLFGAAQLFRIDKANPPVVSDERAPPIVKEVLQRSCYACHSNETAWPWYAEVAPISWLLAYDVHEGRDELNLSTWGSYSSAQQRKKLKEMADTITEGEMPPWYYVYPMHREARLSPADRDAVLAWLTSQAQALGN